MLWKVGNIAVHFAIIGWQHLPGRRTNSLASQQNLTSSAESIEKEIGSVTYRIFITPPNDKLRASNLWRTAQYFFIKCGEAGGAGEPGGGTNLLSGSELLLGVMRVLYWLPREARRGTSNIIALPVSNWTAQSLLTHSEVYRDTALLRSRGLCSECEQMLRTTV
jgi:hypothetical protein